MRLSPYLILVVLLSCQNFNENRDSDAHEKLHRIVAEYQDFNKKEYPSVRDSVYDHLPSMKEEDIARRAEFSREMLNKTESIDVTNLSDEDLVTWKLLRFIHENIVESYRYKAYLNPLLVDWGFHIDFAMTPSRYEFHNAEDYRNYIKVLNDYPRYTREYIMLLKRGLSEGISQPAIIFEGYEMTFDRHIVDGPEESIFYIPFRNLPDHLDAEERQKLIEMGKSAVKESVVPAYREFSEFMKSDYMVNTRSSLGASELPDGESYYQQRIRYYTTLELSADSIHRLGLQEVHRIHGEMETIIEDLGFEGSFTEFLEFLRTDPRFYAKTPEELLNEAAWIAKKMDGKLPALFGKLPRQPYTVNPVPDHLAPKFTTGRYVGAPINSTKPGQYWVNTYDLPVRTLYTLEALTLHEAVPGHHLQNALTKELDLPNFRQDLYLSAFGEGWGLYSEFLGIEAGFYTDPYSDFGRLTYEMWRACRLVVDTGIHAKGWTRKQTMDFMAENTALSLHEIRTETDRYISWPGQALAYKIGEIKIKQLRKRTEEVLGENFDVREFHDLILSQGTVTLPILEEMVDRYLEEKNN